MTFVWGEDAFDEIERETIWISLTGDIWTEPVQGSKTGSQRYPVIIEF